jgi:hypothetical protein
MLIPVPELIAEEIVHRLQAITFEGGYAFDVSEVVRPNRRGDVVQYKHLSIIVDQGNAERNEDGDHPGNPPALSYRLAFDLKCIVRDSRTEQDSRTINESEMAAAVVKAITDAGSMWYTLGGNAINAEFGDMVPFNSGEGELNGITVPLIVTYRVSETDPYEVRA